jgi:ABC-2 type transport system permease protein
MFAMFKKEVQSYFYSPLAYCVIGIFIFIFSITFINWITNLQTVRFTFSFANIFYSYFYYFILLIPALTMKSFAEERKAGTEVLLMSTPLNVFKIVTGKFLALAFVYLVMMVCTFIFPIITMINGEVMWSSLVCGYVGFFMWGLVCICVGMLVSSFTESQIIAALLGEVCMICLLFVDIIKENLFIQSNIPWLYSFFNWLSPQERFYSFSQGMLRLSDIVFYVTLIVVLLAWTMISVEFRRYRK